MHRQRWQACDTRTLISVTEDPPGHRPTDRAGAQVHLSPSSSRSTATSRQSCCRREKYEALRAAARLNDGRRILDLLYGARTARRRFDGSCDDRALRTASRTHCVAGTRTPGRTLQMYRCTSGRTSACATRFRIHDAPGARYRLPAPSPRRPESSPGAAIVTLAARPTAGLRCDQAPQSSPLRWQACTLRSSSPSASSAATSPA